MKAIIHADLYDYNTYKEDQYILFEEEIIEVGDMIDFPGAEEVIDCKGSLVMPGLTISHSHIYSAFLAGVNYQIRPNNFKQMLEQLFWRLDAGLDIESTYHSAMVQGICHLKNGVTSFIDHHASGHAIKGTLTTLKEVICDTYGMRGIFAFETSDRFDINACIEENISFIKSNKSSQCAGMFGMHASFSLSEKTLEAIAKENEGYPIHVHVAESLQDQQECIEQYGERITWRLDRFGLLNKDSLLAHCIHIDDKEAELIAKRGCTVATNPTSNMNTSNGLINYRLLQEQNIPVVIGNDSLGSNITREYQNMLYGMHLKEGNVNTFSYDHLKGCIEEGYRYIGRRLGINIGRLEKGYVADLIAVPYQKHVPVNNSNIMGFFVESVLNNFHPKNVWCGGQMKLKDYQTTWDEEKIYQEATEVAKKVWNRTGGIY